jgi:3-deoxy-D-arabino-heptulosonate 7-phosphate (DAHP) synthase class II
MSKGLTQQCLRSVTTVLQQTNETVTHKRGGSAVNPGNLRGFCKGNAFVKQCGSCEENFFSFQSFSNNEGTILIRQITNIPIYITYKNSKSTTVKAVMMPQSESNDFR